MTLKQAVEKEKGLFSLPFKKRIFKIFLTKHRKITSRIFQSIKHDFQFRFNSTPDRIYIDKKTGYYVIKIDDIDFFCQHSDFREGKFFVKLICASQYCSRKIFFKLEETADLVRILRNEYYCCMNHAPIWQIEK